MSQGSAKRDTASPGWQDYTPTYTNVTVGNGTVAARYQQIGTLVHVRFQFVFGSSSSIDGSAPTISLPVTSSTSGLVGTNTIVGYASLVNTGTEVVIGVSVWNSSTTIVIRVTNAGGTYSTTGNISATVPFTWTTNDEIYLDFTYEAAAATNIVIGRNNDHGGLSGLTDDDHTQYAKLAGDTFTGDVSLPSVFLNFGTKVTYQLSSGVITINGSNVRIDSQTAGADDCDTINGGSDGDIIIVGTVTSSENITLKHNTGNITLPGNADIVLASSGDRTMLVNDGGSWRGLAEPAV